MNNVTLFDENKSINLIIKTAGNSCNINCTYCFEQAKNVEREFITPKKLEKTLNMVKGTCSIVFHGGEPLIVGLEHFSKLLDVVRRYFPQKVIVVRIQTNGTLLNKEWINLFFNIYKDLNIEIAISLDGTEKMNINRVDYFKKETFDVVKNAFELLKKYEKKAGMLSVISRYALSEVDEYVEFISNISNLSFVKMNPLFNTIDNRLTEESILPIEYAEFVYKVACKYLETKLYKKLAIEPILSILQKINNVESRYCNYSSRKCFNYLSIYPDGSMGPCDCFSVNEFMIGNIEMPDMSFLEDFISNYLNTGYSSKIQKLIRICDKCDIKEFCMSGCLSQRYYFENSPNLTMDFCKSKHYLYEKFKVFILNQKKG